MSDTLLIAVIAGLGGMLGWGLADFFAKKTIDQIGDITTLVWAHTIASVLLIGYLATQAVSPSGLARFPDHATEWLSVAFFGVLQAVVYIFVYRGFGKGKVALLSPVFSSYAGLVALLSILVFGEVVSFGVALALGVIFAGILMISIDPDGLRQRNLRTAKHPGLKEILIATVLATVWTLYWAEFIAGKDWKIYASLMYVCMSLAVLVYSVWSRTKLKITNNSVWKYLVGIGLGEIVAYVSISYGFSETSHTSIIALLSGAFSLPVIILSYLFLKERVEMLHRIGSFVIILGIAIISLV